MKNLRQRNNLSQTFFKKLCLSLIASAPLVQVHAADEKPIRTKDWTYSKKVLGTELLCVAETQKKVGETIWTFSVVADPTRSAPPAIYVSSGAGDIGNKLDLQTDSSRSLFSTLRSPNDDAKLASTAYWFAPNKLSTFYQQLRRDSSIKLAYVGADGKEQKLYFSLSGSMATLEALETKCEPKKEVVFLAFFDGLDKQAVAPGSGLRGVDNLKTALSDAWATYFVTGTHATAIKSLDAQMKPYLEQEKAYLARSGKLNGQLDTKNAEKAAIESKKAGYVASRARLAQELEATEQSLGAALADLKIKEDRYRPAAEEVKPFADAYNAATAEVNSYAARISDQESRISAATSRIAALEREERNNRSEINSLESELRDLEVRRARAQSDLNSFNYQWELRRAIDNDTRFRWILDDMRRNEANIQALDRDYRSTESQLRSAEQDLRQCENGRRPNASLAMDTSARGEGRGGDGGGRGGDGGGRGGDGGGRGGNGGGGGGNGGGGGGNGGGGTTPPKPNCSSQESRVRQLRGQLDNIGSNLRREQQNLANNRYALDRRREEIERAVNDHYATLQRNVADLSARISIVESDIRSLDREISDISRNQIPRQRDIISSGRSEVASLTPLLQNARQLQSDRLVDLNTVIARTQFEVKKAEYTAAYQNVESIRKRASSLDTQIKMTDGEIAIQNRALAKVQIEIDALIASLAKESSGLEAIEAILNPLRAQKTAHTEALQAAQVLLMQQMMNYKAIYRDSFLATPPVAAPAAFYEWQI
jgi:predicted  nucleic acid-binding Zn-ribbon protein